MSHRTANAILIGAGQRGRFVYGNYASRNPEQLRFVAVVEPDEVRRRRFAAAHSIPADRQFDRWENAFDASVEASVCVIASPDRHHADPAVAALDRGWNVLLEKPIAHSFIDAMRVLAAARRTAGSLHVSHVLRYTPFFTALHGIVTSGRLGDLITVEHRENVVSWHMAHSFVRGNWANGTSSSPMIVQKCCHDFDIMVWNLQSPATRVQSFGSLKHFRPEHAPTGATTRCTDGCPAAPECPFDAQRIYLDMSRTGWPIHVITDDPTLEGRTQALQEGPYGRCVYTAGSDVVDHQTVSMELESGATAILVMHGHAHRENRTMRYDGTHGTVRAVFGASKAIEFTDHRGGTTESIAIEQTTGGHGGGDPGLIASFLTAIDTGAPSKTSGLTSFESHLLAFGAEDARISGEVVDLSARRATAIAALEERV